MFEIVLGRFYCYFSLFKKLILIKVVEIVCRVSLLDHIDCRRLVHIIFELVRLNFLDLLGGLSLLLIVGLPFEDVHAQIGYELHLLLSILAGQNLLSSNFGIHLQNSSADIDHALHKSFVAQRLDVGDYIEHRTVEIPAIRSEDMMDELQEEIDALPAEILLLDLVFTDIQLFEDVHLC